MYLDCTMSRFRRYAHYDIGTEEYMYKILKYTSIIRVHRYARYEMETGTTLALVSV